MKHCWILALLAACGTDDARPPTDEVVVLEIMRPSCAKVQCHSTTTQQHAPLGDYGLVFDSIDRAKLSISHVGTPRVLARINGCVEPRMPFDTPLTAADHDLLESWLMTFPDAPQLQCTLLP